MRVSTRITVQGTRKIQQQDFRRDVEGFFTSFERKYDNIIPQNCDILVRHDEAALNVWNGARRD
jgi:hypothetical protein